MSQTESTKQASDFALRPPVAPTCVDGLDVSLQVAVDGKNLVAARVGTWPLSHLFMVLLHVLLQRPMLGVSLIYQRPKAAC